MVSLGQAAIMTALMGLVIFFCRVFPFFFFRGDLRADQKTGKKGKAQAAFLSLVEKTAPPVAMTVLAFNAIGGPIRENPQGSIPVLAAAAFTALVHLWKRNSLISIIGGTAVYMVLSRIM
ncbi:branched-chain amino acid transport [Treponema primitia ZAS-2]|uniref:Branched-chain amino acid transport n=1 Tax=Treponema primitia (strain ATCC BAA-887 / DSM 12427 / ZAS-2) TaxID=545694 RepID=F5YJ98_TREPZ|nr:AzlD domain-containing protein [Treponema primitia]AEF87020.1 branched-chain amino acid transport [Treponema primitia ZAS-2]